jgi:hypothetical protein
MPCFVDDARLLEQPGHTRIVLGAIVGFRLFATESSNAGILLPAMPPPQERLVQAAFCVAPPPSAALCRRCDSE